MATERMHGKTAPDMIVTVNAKNEIASVHFSDNDGSKITRGNLQTEPITGSLRRASVLQVQVWESGGKTMRLVIAYDGSVYRTDQDNGKSDVVITVGHDHAIKQVRFGATMVEKPTGKLGGAPISGNLLAGVWLEVFTLEHVHQGKDIEMEVCTVSHAVSCLYVKHCP
jgi:hypothetical protein